MTKKLIFTIVAVLFITANSMAQEKIPWWKKLFKKETVEQNQNNTNNEKTPVSDPVENTVKDSVEIEPVPVLTPSENMEKPLLKDGTGTVRIHHALPLDSINSNLAKEEMDGFRIQIYFGNLTQAKNVKANYMSRRTGDQVYLELKAPNYVVMVGNFRNKIEAYQNLHRIQRHYPKAIIVESKIE